MDIVKIEKEREYKRTIDVFTKKMLFFNVEAINKRESIHYLKFDYVTLEDIGGVMREASLLGLEVGVSRGYYEIEYICF